MERRLLDYLPYLLREHPQFRAAMEAQQPEFEAAWDTAVSLRDDFFVLTAGNRGLSRWERLLGILPKASDSFDARRARILAAMNRHLPYTLPQLRQVLNSLYGPGAASADVAEYSYILCVDIPFTDTWADTIELVDAMSPQNLLARYTAHLQDAHLTTYTAAAPCGMTSSYTIRLPGTVRPRAVRATAHAAGAVSGARMQATVSLPGVIEPRIILAQTNAAGAAASAQMRTTVTLPGVIQPKTIRAEAFAAGHPANSHEIITIKIGGTL